MFRRVVVLIGLLLAAMAPASPALAQASPTCQYILGFKTLHALAPSDIGECLDNQAFAANGDAQQHTTLGLLAWRNLDNWTAFTNGYWTWINGPNGLAKRLNTQRFGWEANPTGLPLIVATGGGGATVVVASPAAGTAIVVAPAPVGAAPGYTFYASSHYGADTIYCDDDPAWKALSPAYLVTYPTLDAAQAALPTYHIHQPC